MTPWQAVHTTTPREALESARTTVRTELWPVPVVGVLLAVVAGVLLPVLDLHVDSGLPAGVTSYLFGGGVEAARKILGVIAGSLITVTSLTFSLTVVTLQLASSQFSPRLLRTFTRDRFVHYTLALFLGTFTYALTVLRTVSDATGRNAFVPQISVTIGYVLAVLSVLGLVLFLSHLAREIRVETTLRNVHREASDTVGRCTQEIPRGRPAPVPTAPADAVPLLAATSGFLLGVDEADLVETATQHDAVVRVERIPGDSLVAGTPIGRFWAVTGTLVVDVRTSMQESLGRAITVGFERNESRDVGYGLRQLADVASKALSPGINDPTTAVHALGHTAALLCELAGRDLGTSALRDADGTVRVILDRPSLGDLLDAYLTQPRRYGAGDPLVLSRLADLLRELAWSVRTGVDRESVAGQLARLRATVERGDFDATERAGLAQHMDMVDDVLAGRPGTSC